MAGRCPNCWGSVLSGDVFYWSADGRPVTISRRSCPRLQIFQTGDRGFWIGDYNKEAVSSSNLHGVTGFVSFTEWLIGKRKFILDAELHHYIKNATLFLSISSISEREIVPALP